MVHLAEYESVRAYVEQFILSTKACLILVYTDSQSAESLNFAIILLPNANMFIKKFSAVVESFLSMIES